MDKLREQIELLEIILGYALFAYNDGWIIKDEMDLYRDYVTTGILNLFKSQVEGLTVIGDAEITKAINKVYPSGRGTYQVNPADKAISKAQLRADKDKLKGGME